MKINRAQLGELLLLDSLSRYACVPAEEELDYSFSEQFQAKIRKYWRKSESAVWRTWHTPVKRAIVIAVIIALMLTALACAVPVIKRAMIKFELVEDWQGAYGVIFDPEMAAQAPREMEEFYIPTYKPRGYELIIDDMQVTGVDYVWTNDNDEVIWYTQRRIPENPTAGTSFKINAEGTHRSTLFIDGYLVEIIACEERDQYDALWTDERYFYSLGISIIDGNPEKILREMIKSLVLVE